MPLVTKILVIALLMVAITSPTVAQPLAVGFTETSDPGVPFMVEAVLAEPAVRFQSHFVSISGADGGESSLLIPLRLLGTFAFTDRVVGELSLPVFLELPSEGDTAFQFGNPRIGLEAPLLVAGGRTHRVTFSLDLFLPVSQISNGDDNEERLAAELVRNRYSLMRAAIPTLIPDYANERLPLAVGLHYRLRIQKAVVHMGADVPFLIGFDLDADRPFDEVDILVRYGLMFGYDLRPAFPTLEVSAVTWLTGEHEMSTGLQGTFGLRFVVGKFEPGLAVSWPILMYDSGFETNVYLSLDVAYRWQ